MLLMEIKKDTDKKVKRRNFVAKHAHMNRAATHRDRKNDYQRKPKHKKQQLD